MHAVSHVHISALDSNNLGQVIHTPLHVSLKLIVTITCISVGPRLIITLEVLVADDVNVTELYIKQKCPSRDLKTFCRR